MVKINMQKYSNILLMLFAFILLTVSYSTNIFKITDDNYRYFDRSDEGNVMGRMVLAKEKGIFSKGALTGQYYNYQYSQKDLEGDNPPYTYTQGTEFSKNNRQVVAQLYDDYINDRELSDGSFHAYKSQPGGQALLYCVLQEVLPFSGGLKLNIFRLLTVALSALAFTLFIGWTYRNYGLFVGIGTLLLIFLSPWLFRFAFSLWWALWSFYIPFLTMLLILERRFNKGLKMFDNKLILYLTISVFAKFFFTGGEFITSALVAAVCPIIYYLYLTKTKLKKSIIYLTKASCAACFAVLLGLLQLAVQVRYLEGSWAAGFEQVLFAYTKHNKDSSLMVTSVSDLYSIYIGEHAFKWDFFPYINFGFGILAVIITLFSILVFCLSKKVDKEKQDKNIAIVITTTISILGPLSWLVFFPAHASFHVFLDFLIWYLPYCILGFLVICLGLKLLVDCIIKKRKSCSPTI